MIIPNDTECRRIVLTLADDPSLSEWEADFLDSNLSRHEFTDKQKEVIARLKEKYDV
jgi:hypothetical protein